jgi:hypothetical protein
MIESELNPGVNVTSDEALAGLYYHLVPSHAPRLSVSAEYVTKNLRTVRIHRREAQAQC